MGQKVNELKKLPPLTTSQLNALLPEQLLNLKRSSFEATHMMGFSTADATYKNEDGSQKIKLTLFDCVGDAGAGIYSLNHLTKMNIQSESEDGYTKSIDFMGQKDMETYQKNNNKYKLIFLANDRLLINIETNTLSEDELKPAAASLQIKIPS